MAYQVNRFGIRVAANASASMFAAARPHRLQGAVVAMQNRPWQPATSSSSPFAAPYQNRSGVGLSAAEMVRAAHLPVLPPHTAQANLENVNRATEEGPQVPPKSDRVKAFAILTPEQKESFLQGITTQSQMLQSIEELNECQDEQEVVTDSSSVVPRSDLDDVSDADIDAFISSLFDFDDEDSADIIESQTDKPSKDESEPLNSVRSRIHFFNGPVDAFSLDEKESDLPEYIRSKFGVVKHNPIFDGKSNEEQKENNQADAPVDKESDKKNDR